MNTNQNANIQFTLSPAALNVLKSWRNGEFKTNLAAVDGIFSEIVKQLPPESQYDLICQKLRVNFGIIAFPSDRNPDSCIQKLNELKDGQLFTLDVNTGKFMHINFQMSSGWSDRQRIFKWFANAGEVVEMKMVVTAKT